MIIENFDVVKSTHVTDIPNIIPNFSEKEIESLNELLYNFDSATSIDEESKVIWEVNNKFSDLSKVYFLLDFFNIHYLTQERK